MRSRAWVLLTAVIRPGEGSRADVRAWAWWDGRERSPRRAVPIETFPALRLTVDEILG